MDWKPTITKLLRRQSAAATTTTAAESVDDNPKLPKKLQEYFSQPLDSTSKTFQAIKDDEEVQSIHSFLAELFAGIAAVKAAYAELQLAQTPYDIASIHSADRCVVSELKSLSSFKRSYVSSHTFPSPLNPQRSQIREQSNLIKTFKINITKLESDIHDKNQQIESLCSELERIERRNQSLESRLYGLHLSGLNPTHFLPELRSAVKSIRSFTKSMVKAMELASWDLDSAAEAIYPNLNPNPKNRIFFFQSFVCHRIFTDFHHPDFNLEFLEARSRWNRHDFFHEYNDSKFSSSDQFLHRWGKFVNAKFLAMVHPKMETMGSFGNADSDLFARFVDMAKRVWVLHSLFFSFNGSDFSGSMFRVGSGCRFSEVYMESVEDPDPNSTPTVGFTVVPGFKLGSTVIQCKVYLSSS